MIRLLRAVQRLAFQSSQIIFDRMVMSPSKYDDLDRELRDFADKIKCPEECRENGDLLSEWSR
jgi:hypothetical protein